MNFDFAFPVLYSEQDILYYDALAAELEARGRRVALLPLSREGERRLRANHANVFYLYEGWDRSRAPSPSEMAAIEARYSISLLDHVHPEHMYFWGRRTAELVPRAVHTFGFLERFLERHRVGMFVNNYGGEIVRRTTARLAERGGPPNVFLDGAPFKNRVAISTSEWDWDDLPRPLPALKPAEERLAATMMDEVVRKRPSLGRGAARLRVGLKSLRWSIENIGHAIFDDEPPDFSVAGMHGERALYIARSITHRTLYRQPVPPLGEEPFLFFPLHVPNDSAISVRAPQFLRQDALVEYLALRGLPAGVKLYIKPHPDGVFTYSTRMLHRLQALPNVRLIHPSVGAHALIAAALGVVVINSTVGLEALHHLKPVVALGRVFYRGFGLTRDVNDLLQLPDAVREALDRPPPRDGVLRFLHACHQATTVGRWGDIRPDNIRALADALLAKADRLGGAIRSVSA